MDGTRTLAAIAFDPLLPAPLFVALVLLAGLAVGLALWRRARGAWFRAFASAVLVVALANPRLVQETRRSLPDIAILLVDQTASQRVGERMAMTESARRALEDKARTLDALELRTVVVPEAGANGTRLFEALARALAEVPRGRLAGTIAITDGQIHDAPEEGEAIARATGGAPFHLLLTGRRGETDRRLRILDAPPFGIVGRSVEVRFVVEDLGTVGGAESVTITQRRDGEPLRQARIRLGEPHTIRLPMERAGQTVLEIEAEALPGEVSLLNNRAVVAVNGVRDRLRVLLVSGEPHAGQRTWRRLLKADPNVDLVHFTILRPPEKDDLTPLSELALIAFPVRELFQVKLREFDLIIFDRFANRGILPPSYLRNIADYVRGGGGLFLSVGPEYVGPISLFNTPLGQVLPASPTGRIGEGPFRARVSEVGARHPITAALPGANAGDAEPAWGRWYRRIDVAAPRGQVLMTGPAGEPLLIADRIGEGRVALLLTDQIWLWSRNHDGGGPQAEVLRRAAHWLMKEPDLEEEDLRARVEGERIVIERRSLNEGPPPELTVIAPSGETRLLALETLAPGRAGAEVQADQPGVWRITDGARLAFAAVGAGNPREFLDLRALAEPAAAVAQRSGGAVAWLADQVPDLRRVGADRPARGPGWIGLRRNRDHIVTGVSDLPLMPPWVALILILSAAVIAWRREGQ